MADDGDDREKPSGTPEADSPWSRCIEARSRGIGLVGEARSRPSRPSRQVKLRPAAECVPDSYGWPSIEEDARRIARLSGPVELPRADDWVPDSYADESPWARGSRRDAPDAADPADPPDPADPTTAPDAPDAPNLPLAPDAPSGPTDNLSQFIPERWVRAGVTDVESFLRCANGCTPMPADDDDSSWARCIRARRGGTPLASADRDDRRSRSTPVPPVPPRPPCQGVSPSDVWNPLGQRRHE